MTVLDDVARFIERLGPAPIRDDCIAHRLGFSVRQHASRKTREFAGRNGFERRKDACSLCDVEKFVIRKSPV